MPIQPSDFLDLAESLSKRKPIAVGESCSRTAIGRAYYASYLTVRETVRSAYGTRDDFDHAPLRQYLSGATDTGVAEVGQRLKTLWKYRRVSDYEPGDTVAAHIVGLMVSNAQYILKHAPALISKIPPGIPPKTK
jgi:hypothetical protein